MAARRVERSREQGAGARRLDQRHAAIDDLPRRSDRRAPRWRIADWVRLPSSLWTEESTRSAPDSSAAAGSSSLEPQVGAPCLVDDQRHTARVRDLGEAGDVGDRAEVGRRDDHRADGVGRRGQRRVERVRGDAVGDVELGVELGCDEGGLQPREDRSRRSCSSGRCAARRRGVPCGAAARQAAWFPCEAPLIRNQLRRAPHASAASRWARVERGRVGTDVDALDQRRDVVLRAPRCRTPRPAPDRLRGRPCGRGRGSARARGRRTRSAHRGTGPRAARGRPRGSSGGATAKRLRSIAGESSPAAWTPGGHGLLASLGRVGDERRRPPSESAATTGDPLARATPPT